MIPTENQESPVLSGGTIHGLPVEDVKGSQPVRPDSDPNGNQFIHPFGEDRMRKDHLAWACSLLPAGEPGRNIGDIQPKLVMLPLQAIKPHPDNPRMMVRHDVIESIADQLRSLGRYPLEHAILVRQVHDHYEILSGHQRFTAALEAGLTEIACWVVEVSDEEADIALLTANQQGELSPLEVGLHAHKVIQKYDRDGLTVSKFAEKIGKSQSTVTELRQAASVYRTADESIGRPIDFQHASNKVSHLAAIHGTPREYWAPLTEKTLEQDENRKSLSVKTVKQVVKEIRNAEELLGGGAKLLGYIDRARLRDKVLSEIPDISVVKTLKIIDALSEKASRLLSEEVTYYEFDSESGEVLEEGVHNRQKEFVECLMKTPHLNLEDAEEELHAIAQEDDAHSRGAAEALRLEWLQEKSPAPTEPLTPPEEHIRVQEDGTILITAAGSPTEEQRKELAKCIAQLVEDFMASLSGQQGPSK
ncbi:MAG: ParB/RepB/Spo0J family partition protein [Desulfomonilaceae bacterium]